MSITGLPESVAAQKLEVTNICEASTEIFGLDYARGGRYFRFNSESRGFWGAVHGLDLFSLKFL